VMLLDSNTGNAQSPKAPCTQQKQRSNPVPDFGD
jgi:hypothetical protein